MKNIIDELLKKSDILDISASIAHFMMHTENQIDSWFVTHDFKKDDTYYEMCRDAGRVFYTITMDLIEFRKTVNDLMAVVALATIIDYCRKYLDCIVGEKLEYENCARYDIEVELNDDGSAAKIYIPKRFVSNLRDTIYHKLHDDPLYGNFDGTSAAIDKEMMQHNILSAAIKSYNESNQNKEE